MQKADLDLAATIRTNPRCHKILCYTSHDAEGSWLRADVDQSLRRTRAHRCACELNVDAAVVAAVVPSRPIGTATLLAHDSQSSEPGVNRSASGHSRHAIVHHDGARPSATRLDSPTAQSAFDDAGTARLKLTTLR